MSRRFLLPLLLLLAAACGSDPAGPGTEPPPPPPPPPAAWFLRLEVSSVVVREMCDGFPIDVDGGEWSHRLEVRFPGEPSILVGATSNFPSASFVRNAGRGGSLALDANAKIIQRQQLAQAGDKVTLTLRATEWDYDIFGNNPFPDSRMNNRSATASLNYADGTWPEAPAGKLTLQNTGSCIVDVNYTFEAVEQ